MRFCSRFLLVLACLATAPPALAQPLTLREDGGEVSILADQIEQVGQDGLLIATGNVEITRGTSRLTADRVELNRQTGEAVAQGRVVFYDGQDRLLGDRIDFNLRTGTGVVYNGSAFSAPYYRLSGERMERLGEGVYEIRRGIFTTCEAEPPPWSFRAERVTADLDDFLVARDASFWVGRVPLIPWVPFFAAAIRRERQSGFLLPTLGVSSRKGVFAKIPYFWAISDSQDFTLSLDTYSRRGVGGSAEYRYVLSETSRGVAEGFFIRETFRDDDDRGRFAFKHDWQVTPRLTFRTDINAVSDDRFFRTYGDRLSERSLQRAESNVFATWRGESWNLVANALWYQDLTQERPVELQRLPEIRFQSLRQPVPGLAPVLYEVESSFSNFVRDVGSDGRRLDLHPRAFLPLSVAGFFTVTPFLGGRGTYYDTRVVGKRLARNGDLEVEVTEDASRVRAQGELGADLEARATRVYELGGAGGIDRLQHLVEPRVNITEIRGVNQKGLPQYDPAVDRIGKVSELAYSVTNRLNAKTVAGAEQEAVRWELGRLLLSQTYNLLPEAGEPFSDLKGDLILQPNRYLRFRGDLSYNVYGRGVETVNSDISTSVRDVTATVGTRFDDRAAIEFVKGEVQAKASRYLDVRAATNWDVRSGAVVESRFGLDLHFQCWALFIEYIDRARNEDEVRFAINLLGVGHVGSRTGVTGTR